MLCRARSIEIDPVEAWDADDTTTTHDVTGEQAAELFRLARLAEEAAARVERDIAWWLEERGLPALALQILSGAWRAAATHQRREIP